MPILGSKNLVNLASASMLPTELLGEIFNFSYQSSRESLYRCTHNRIEEACECPDEEFVGWREKDTLTTSCHFPDALASVCTKWRELLLTRPHYWTRIVIFVDEDPALEDLKARLTLTRDLPLSINILRRSGDGNDAEEDERVRAVMDVIRLYFPRCYSIRFNLLHSTSLPAVADFRAAGASLRELKLQCKAYVEDPHYQVPTAPFPFVVFPEIRVLALNGETFLDAAKNPTWITETLSKAKPLLSLSIGHFRPVWNKITYREHRASVYHLLNILTVIPKIVNLEIDDIDAPFSFDDDRNEESAIYIRAHHVKLSNLGDEFIDIVMYLSYFQKRSLHITNSSLQFLNSPLVSTITLEKIPSSSEILSRYLSAYTWCDLTLIDCPAFDDQSLEMLMKWSPNSLRVLRIKNCPNFTVDALRELVKLRKRERIGMGTSRMPWERSGMQWLSVSGSGPELSLDDARYLEDNVETFHWNTQREDGPVCGPYGKWCAEDIHAGPASSGFAEWLKSQIPLPEQS
ncbi:hypothetical protein BDQ12DRAFT_683525 [Crucibulum laeve]|uniref:F-box domain-containing protein n=1 Tax=Crucibulum laeve TaxID=68775 RepID=A0A5C3LZQ9_9AGAR|nr:hypothetical protein BDQ12DRAFT_683525 [Crucibulum laeve]